MAERDFLDQLVAERTAADPDYPQIVAEAARRRQLLSALAEKRREQDRSQTAVAAAMQISQSSIARLESSATDARLSTIDRYARALGYTVQYHLVANTPPFPPPLARPHERRG